MRTPRHRLVAWLLAGLATLGWLTGCARAPEGPDVIRNLDTEYTINADGTVDVVQNYDWVFGGDGRHGIVVTIATREAWDADPTLGVVYDITRIDTTSPTGAPADRTLEVVTSGRVSGYAVRIGDPDQTVRGRAQTYRVSYQIAGALRTFDGVPELHWDVTSEDMPTIQRFTTTVRAPQGITRAHCYVGDRDCATALADGVATLSGSEAAVGDTITVAAALPAGSVAGAEPRLESPLSVESEVSAIDATATVHPDGSMTVEQTMDWVFPRGRASLWFALPGSQPWSTGEDLVRSYSGVQLLLDGRPLEVEPFGYTSGRSNESVRLAIARPQPLNRRDREQLVDVFAAATDATLGRYAAADAGSRRGGAVRRWWPLAVAAVAVLAAGTYLTRSLSAGGVLVCFLLVALFAGAAHGAFVTRQRVLAGRSAVGTAARDQVLGFRQFLATAEADQLDFEAGEDIYRRHLPWAALFGLTERWTRVGQELAAAGLIEAIDLSDLGLTSAADADAAVRLGAGRAHEPPGRRLVGRGLVGQSWRLVLGGGQFGQFGQFVGVAWRRRGGSGGGGTSGHSW